MKRLFLASSGLGAIKDFMHKDPPDMRMLFVPTAGNLDTDVWWIDKDRDVLTRMGFQLTELDIARKSLRELEAALAEADIVYIAGGNTFYLLHQLRTTGFDKLLTDFVHGGGLYAGASAGALVAGKDIEPVASLDEPEKVPELTSTAGLGLVDFVPIPHYDFGNRKPGIDKVKKRYSNTYDLIILTDDQAIVAEGDTHTVIESRRSQLEMDWLNNSGES